MIAWLRFIIGSAFLLAGLMVFILEVFGVFRFHFVLNRMHAAGMGDTAGLGLALSGLMIFSGWNFTTLKMFLVLVFLWCASPVSSHLISRLEVTTDENLSEFCEVEEES